MEDIKNNQKKLSVVSRARNFFMRGIWDMPVKETRGLKSMLLTFMRVAFISVSGIVNKRILVQASSLSYATLLAIGPILAITILFSGMFFKDKGEQFIYEKIMDAATFVMPAFNEMMPDDDAKAIAAASEIAAESHADGVKAINPQIFEFINNISRGSSSAGTIGILTMLVTCLLLCINMEAALNYVWDVRKGRKWVDRIVFYFAMVFFGSVGTIFCMTFLATSKLSSILKDIPVVSEYLSGYVAWITFVLGLGLLTAMLACFYKFFPCANVKWRPAFIGAVVIVFLLFLNNKMSFIYISYIVKQQSFYGYLAIVAVAMFSLYVFWVMILSGGMIAFAVQYVDFISDDDGWRKMGVRAREMSALAVFARICGNFCSSRVGEAAVPTTTESLGAALRLPKSVVGECISMLIAKNLVCRVESADGPGIFSFKPAVSPSNITLADFFAGVLSNSDDSGVVASLARIEPAVAFAAKSIDEFGIDILSKKTMADILK